MAGPQHEPPIAAQKRPEVESVFGREPLEHAHLRAEQGDGMIFLLDSLNASVDRQFRRILANRPFPCDGEPHAALEVSELPRGHLPVEIGEILVRWEWKAGFAVEPAAEFDRHSRRNLLEWQIVPRLERRALPAGTDHQLHREGMRGGEPRDGARRALHTGGIVGVGEGVADVVEDPDMAPRNVFQGDTDIVEGCGLLPGKGPDADRAGTIELVRLRHDVALEIIGADVVLTIRMEQPHRIRRVAEGERSHELRMRHQERRFANARLPRHPVAIQPV